MKILSGATVIDSHTHVNYTGVRTQTCSYVQVAIAVGTNYSTSLQGSWEKVIA